jgi:hypothetical protein
MPKKEYIKLANAHVTQVTNKGKKSEWSIEENITNNQLHVLPGNLGDKLIFNILNFARKFELIAFNEGIEFGKEKQRESSAKIERELTQKLQIATGENIRLAEALDNIHIKH